MVSRKGALRLTNFCAAVAMAGHAQQRALMPRQRNYDAQWDPRKECANGCGFVAAPPYCAYAAEKGHRYPCNAHAVAIGCAMNKKARAPGWHDPEGKFYCQTCIRGPVGIQLNPVYDVDQVMSRCVRKRSELERTDELLCETCREWCLNMRLWYKTNLPPLEHAIEEQQNNRRVVDALREAAVDQQNQYRQAAAQWPGLAGDPWAAAQAPQQVELVEPEGMRANRDPAAPARGDAYDPWNPPRAPPQPREQQAPLPPPQEAEPPFRGQFHRGPPPPLARVQLGMPPAAAENGAERAATAGVAAAHQGAAAVAAANAGAPIEAPIGGVWPMTDNSDDGNCKAAAMVARLVNELKKKGVLDSSFDVTDVSGSASDGDDRNEETAETRIQPGANASASSGTSAVPQAATVTEAGVDQGQAAAAAGGGAAASTGGAPSVTESVQSRSSWALEDGEGRGTCGALR